MTLGYKLLTPGPLTTTPTVKETMLVDHCTWDDDYKQITQEIRGKLLKLAHVDQTEYTAILMQGSGTFGVEAVFSSVIGENDTLLILSNGAYGARMAEIAKAHKINYLFHETPLDKQPSAEEVEIFLGEHPEVTHLAMVHSETTTGVLNDIESISKVAKKYNLTYIVDAMSSFGGIEIDVAALNIDYIISSANKCIQGVPGFSFVIAKLDNFLASRGNARTLSLNLHDQWDTMEVDGKWRFTSPTHVVLAFQQALLELEAEGGIKGRNVRYNYNMGLLRQSFNKIGLKPYISEDIQGPIIATFYYPEDKLFDFESMYQFIKARGYAIYPGKLNNMNTFRIGVIGDIFSEDINRMTGTMVEYLWEAKKCL